jgi:hypothetical protein
MKLNDDVTCAMVAFISEVCRPRQVRGPRGGWVHLERHSCEMTAAREVGLYWAAARQCGSSQPNPSTFAAATRRLLLVLTTLRTYMHLDTVYTFDAPFPVFNFVVAHCCLQLAKSI